MDMEQVPKLLIDFVLDEPIKPQDFPKTELTNPIVLRPRKGLVCSSINNYVLCKKYRLSTGISEKCDYIHASPLDKVRHPSKIEFKYYELCLDKIV